MMKEISLAKIYFGLAVYFLVVGVFGWLRTDSLVPLLITGGAGVITGFLGSQLKSGSFMVRYIGQGWLLGFAGAALYSAFGKISAHTQSRPESIYIFLSMAILCGIGFVFTVRDLKRARHEVRSS